MKTLRTLIVAVCATAVLTLGAHADQAKCCTTADDKGKDCEHPCCVTAAKDAKECEKCGGKGAMANVAGGCCKKAKVDGKTCAHDCCVTAAKDGKNCEKCGGKGKIKKAKEEKKSEKPADAK